ncbi:MAG TPA: hypothetical protein VEZ17_05365, partial [Chitinophagaceae bacterium]|nr:hypothetical protein [Chitinophagaceae bacterium]
MKFFTLKALCLLASACFCISPATGFGQTQTARSVSMTPNSRGFYEYLPQNYNSESQSYPLLVFIHGIGELGDGSQGSLPIVLQNGPPRLINQGTFPTSFTVNGQSFKFIVISPQFVYWPGPNDVQGVIDYCVRTYRVDANRIYLSGLSMGGGATWEFASNSETNANRLAAIVPVCGALGPDMARAKTMATANLPVWATHNDADPAVNPYFTNTWVDWMNASTPKPGPLARKTMFPGYWHDAWSTTYDPNYRENNLNVYEWMLQYKRGTSTPPPPPTPVLIPGKVEAENYSAMNGVNTESTGDAGGGRNV